jgi:hypothetical protein
MLQFAMNSASRFSSADRHAGSGSDWKELPPVYSPRLSSFRLVRLLMEFGTLPLSWLPNSWSSSRPTRRPISAGILPVRPQRQMHRRRRVVSWHSSLGMIPTRPVQIICLNHVQERRKGCKDTEKHYRNAPGMVASSIMRR